MPKTGVIIPSSSFLLFCTGFEWNLYVFSTKAFLFLCFLNQSMLWWLPVALVPFMLWIYALYIWFLAHIQHKVATSEKILSLDLFLWGNIYLMGESSISAAYIPKTSLRYLPFSSHTASLWSEGKQKKGFPGLHVQDTWAAVPFVKVKKGYVTKTIYLTVRQLWRNWQLEKLNFWIGRIFLNRKWITAAFCFVFFSFEDICQFWVSSVGLELFLEEKIYI